MIEILHKKKMSREGGMYLYWFIMQLKALKLVTDLGVSVDGLPGETVVITTYR